MSAPMVKTKTPGIFKRGSRYVVVYRDNRGRQHKQSAATIAEARALKSAHQADVARGEYRALSRVTFAEYVTEWAKTYNGRTARGIRAETLADYRRTLGVGEDGELLERDGEHVGSVAFFGAMRLSEIEPRDVKRYAASVAERGVSANTVRLTLAPVKALLATAVEEGLIRSNPAAGLRLTHSTVDPDADGERVKALTEDELRALLAEVAPERRPLVEFLAHTGLRISEALALRWSDLDFGRRRVQVRRRLYRGSIGQPKTRHGRRDVPLSEGMGRQLWELRKAAGSRSDDAPIFGDAAGEPLDRWVVFRAVRAAGTRAGVPWVGLHTLRHTCATMLFRSGLNAKQVQMWLGHHSPAFTLATYVHLLPDDLPEPKFLDSLTVVGTPGSAGVEPESQASNL